MPPVPWRDDLKIDHQSEIIKVAKKGLDAQHLCVPGVQDSSFRIVSKHVF